MPAPTPIAWPSTLEYAADSAFALIWNTLTHSSPLSRSTQTIELPGAAWAASLVLPSLAKVDRKLLQVTLNSLRGTAGRVYFGDPAYLLEGPDGTASGTPLVMGGGQTGRSLATDGWGLSETVLAKGDYFSFDTTAGRELKQVNADISSDGAGAATLTFDMPIRNAPADNAPITVDGATCIMALTSDSQNRLQYLRGGDAGILTAPVTLELIEMFT